MLAEMGKRVVSLAEPPRVSSTTTVPHLSHAIGVDVIQADEVYRTARVSRTEAA